jgi:hypothetical protein
MTENACMSRFSNSVELAKSSLGVLQKDKSLATIPVMSAVACGIVVLLFGGAAYLTVDTITEPGTTTTTWQVTPATWAIGIVGLLVVGFVAQFFGAVLVAGANERLEGGDPTLGSAFRRASQHGGAILGWAAINATVGAILQAIRERTGFLGAIATSLVGMAWNVVTWLAVPAIVVEGLGPIEAIRRSVQLLKQTWGENLIAQIGLGAIGFLAVLPGLVVSGLLWLVSPIAFIVVFVLWVAAVSVVMTALGAIYRTALFRFATGLPNGSDFDPELLAGAFRPKTGASRLLG